ncbi:progestin and adipoQ receptor family member 3 [Galendromus occidentalis]|uniref:Progestin and adipoQ receptor family member 3 n=1 Tax=Galendromus occidentalis TaxID=34638 RepID=A0AAJ6QR58_9ACAR|nr:progestin and adipoQ receptor family member 3 [Galendromus occidentalis]
MESNTQTIHRTRKKSEIAEPRSQEASGECSNFLAECQIGVNDMRLLKDMLKNDLKYLKNRLLRSPSESDICGVDDQTKPLVCSIDEAPSFQTSNKYITNGYRTSKSKERCIKGILQWTNETVNIWTHLGPLIVLIFRYSEDVLLNYDAAKFEPFDRKLSSFMLLCYSMMLGLSSVYHIFNCCCCKCFRYWYGWDFVGVSLSIYAYGTGFLFLQFRGSPFWIIFYGTIKTIIAGVPIGMVFSTKYFDKKYDDSRSVWIGGFVLFNIIPTVHSILLRGGLEDPVVKATLPPHLVVMFLLVGSFVIYANQFPERYVPGRVDYVGNSHQIWHVGTATAVFFARHLYFQYILAFNGLT